MMAWPYAVFKSLSSIVSEGFKLVATMASLKVAIISFNSAIDKLLLREGQKFSSCSKVCTFEASDGGEGPT